MFSICSYRVLESSEQRQQQNDSTAIDPLLPANGLGFHSLRVRESRFPHRYRDAAVLMENELAGLPPFIPQLFIEVTTRRGGAVVARSQQQLHASWRSHSSNQSLLPFRSGSDLSIHVVEVCIFFRCIIDRSAQNASNIVLVSVW